eukprot:CAMPEP_0170553070 /NCGR_PEP_ID=MMETSP0211-20121228/10927_1 /TAXON_ID=311385 /ORGANISM="Pseudokeronopsis sp., Strain OXSARD2" /LENGTH=43 /DNA_ID= /DNA_START= /DNA_END= /DNA_ORIENTATION=
MAKLEKLEVVEFKQSQKITKEETKDETKDEMEMKQLDVKYEQA